jgi:hypothetical protein
MSSEGTSALSVSGPESPRVAMKPLGIDEAVGIEVSPVAERLLLR